MAALARFLDKLTGANKRKRQLEVEQTALAVREQHKQLVETEGPWFLVVHCTVHPRPDVPIGVTMQELTAYFHGTVGERTDVRINAVTEQKVANGRLFVMSVAINEEYKR